MSPIDFPDLLEERGPSKKMSSEERGRKSASSRLISNLRSRSRSRSRRRSKSAQRRAASCQPTERSRKDEKLDSSLEKKQRRSLSRPSRRPKEMSTKEDKYAIRGSSHHKPSEVVEIKKKRSPSKSKSPSSKPKKEWSADIINLVDRDVDDVLFNDILKQKNPIVNPPLPKSLEGKNKTVTITTRSSSKDDSNKMSKRKISSPSKRDKYSGSNHGSPIAVSRFPSDTYSDEETSDDDDSDDDDDESKSVDAKDLLAQVNARMEQQRLMEEVKELRGVVEKKDAEIEQLTGQLRMAISTKCDLVIAHTELERLHEMDLHHRDQYAEAMKRSNLALMEVRAEVEKEFMNELTNLAKQVQEAETRREEDVKEKDETIRLLEDKIKRMERNALQGSSARPDTDKVRYYKKKLGVYDQ